MQFFKENNAKWVVVDAGIEHELKDIEDSQKVLQDRLGSAAENKKIFPIDGMTEEEFALLAQNVQKISVEQASAISNVSNVNVLICV